MRLPERILVIPKGWELNPVDEAQEMPCEVIVSCKVSCKKQLNDARSAIKAARADREKLESKKKRFA